MSRMRRRYLIRLGRRSGAPDTALRFLAVARLGIGRNTVQVAEELVVARSTVVRSAARFSRDGVLGLYDQRRYNGQSKVTATLRQRVTRLLRRTPEDVGWSRPTWTRELLCLQIQREGWPLVAVCTMGRVLAQVGARLGMPKPIVLCPWPRDARQKKLATIRGLEARACRSEPVLYSDEVDIHLNPRIGRDWMLRGTQRRIVTPGQNKKFYLAGALDVRTGKLHVTGGWRKNALLFCELLRLLAARYPRARQIHLVIDNYVIHSAHVVLRQLADLKDRVVLHFLPPYCPDHNRIERVWQDLHANVTRNHRCKNIAKLLSKARVYLDNYVWRRVTGVQPLLHRPA
jgi:transposase